MPGYIAEMLLKLALNTNQSIIKKKISYRESVFISKSCEIYWILYLSKLFVAL